MKGLLTKISNQINKRCRAKINKDDMLEGDVEKCIRDLDESIDCCKQWKTICQRTQQLIRKYSSRQGWTLHEDETIFAENEAFIQRCKDLKEICEGQLQFARKGANCQMPVFGGTKGKEWTHNLEGLQTMFEKNLQSIKDLKYDILEVKETRWHDDYGQVFKDQVKGIEVMYQNIIALTFKHINTVSDGVEMLENFDTLAKRPMVKDYVHKKAAECVYKLFTDEIKEVEDMFESSTKRRVPMPVSHPHYGGRSIWVYSLIKRINKAKDAIDDLYFIKDHPHHKEAIEKYTKLLNSLDTFLTTTNHQEWLGQINELQANNGKQIDATLATQILIRSEHVDKDLPADLASNAMFIKSKKSGLLESNFNSELLKVLVEVQYINKIQSLGLVTIPHAITKLFQKRDTIRILRENVMLIVRDYNLIMHSIGDEEKALFKEHLAELDKHIKPGVERHSWNSPADKFTIECRNKARVILAMIKQFQYHKLEIKDQFELISSTILTNIEKKLYKLPEFVQQQKASLRKEQGNFLEAFDVVKKLLIDTYSELFITRKASIQAEWLKFVGNLDAELLKALKHSVKNSLLDLQKHIQGD